MQQGDGRGEQVGIRVLVSPLDWGLGHATRVIPLIRALLAEGCEVTVAASGATRVLLISEFPNLPFLHIPGYRVQYPQKGSHFFQKMVIQLPRIFFAIVREHLWLRRAMRLHRWDAVVSDNRYGLFHPRSRCVILTHQVRIQTGRRWVDRMVRRPLEWVVKCFDECWVPDMPGEPNLAGELCHGPMHMAVRYIGPLSRLCVEKSPGLHLLILLSGPEPQRSIFEAVLQESLGEAGLPIVVVRGLPGTGQRRKDAMGVEWIDHADALQLQELMADARLIIARSGYSTVMDLVRTRRAAVLVPTPGQPEQEYLARHLSNMGLFLSMTQKDIRIQKALQMAKEYEADHAAFDFDRHKGILREWLSTVNQKTGFVDA